MSEDSECAPMPALQLGELFAKHRERLCRIVSLRMDRRLRGRIDASDVIQEAFLEATQRYEDFTRQPGQSFYLWLRFLTLQQLLIAARRHLSTQARAAGREVDLEAAVSSEISAVGLADIILDSVTSPSEAAARLDRATQLQTALEAMEPLDREVLVLRHFEHMSNAEAAEALVIQPGTASQRYFRALKKLKDILQNLGWSETP